MKKTMTLSLNLIAWSLTMMAGLLSFPAQAQYETDRQLEARRDYENNRNERSTDYMNEQHREAAAALSRDQFDGRWALEREMTQMRILGQQALTRCRQTAAGCHSRFAGNPGSHPGVTSIASLLGRTPAEKQQLATQAGTLLAAYWPVATRLGLARNEVAASMGYCFASAMSVWRGQVPVLSPQPLAKVVAQTRQLLSSNGSMAAADDAERQKRYERYAIIGVYLNTEFRAASEAGDQARIASVRKMAGEMVQDIAGVAPGQLTLARDGTVTVSGKTVPAPATVARPVAGRPARAVPQPAQVPTASGGATRFSAGQPQLGDRAMLAKVAQFDQLVRSRGGDPNDVAWGAAVAFAIYFYVGRDVQMTNRQIAGTVALARTQLAEAAATASDQQKREAYNQYAAPAMQMLNLYSDAQRNQASVSRFGESMGRQDAARMVGQLHKDALSSISLLLNPYRLEDFEMTPDGLVKVR